MSRKYNWISKNRFLVLVCIIVAFIFVACSFKSEEEVDGIVNDSSSSKDISDTNVATLSTGEVGNYTLPFIASKILTGKEDLKIDFSPFKAVERDFQYKLLKPPVHGVIEGCFLENETDNNCQYVPNINFTGEDRLEYEVKVPGTDNKQAVVIKFVIQAVNDPPLLNETPDLTLFVSGGEQLQVELPTGEDVDSNNLVYKISELPRHGVLEECIGEDAELKKCIYTPDMYFEGTDSFTYRVVDEQGLSSAKVGTITINVSKAQDSDGDLLPDLLELESGKNPFISNLSRLELTGESHLKTSFNLNHPGNGSTRSINLSSIKDQSDSSLALREYLLCEAYKKHQGVLDNVPWSFDDRFLHLFKLSNWQFADQIKKMFEIEDLVQEMFEFAENSGEVNFSHRFGLANNPGIKEIENVSINLFVFDGGLKSLGTQKSTTHDGSSTVLNLVDGLSNEEETLFSLSYKKLSPYVTSSVVKNSLGLYASVADYQINYLNNKSILYKDLLKNVYSKTARIIISTENETNIYYVSPKLFTTNNSIIECLNKLKKPVEIDSSEQILSIANYKTDHLGPIDLYQVPLNLLNKKLWTYLSQDKTSLLDPIVVGKTYAFVFSTISQLAAAKNEVRELDATQKVGLIAGQTTPIKHQVIKNLKAGDEITLTIKNPTVNKYRVQDYTKLVSHWDLEHYCSRNETVCTKEEKTCIHWTPMLWTPSEQKSRGGSGDGRVCEKWKVRCIKNEQVCREYADRPTNVSNCDVLYQSYEEQRVPVSFSEDSVGEFVDRIVILGKNGNYFHINELLADNTEPVVVESLGGSKSKYVARLKINSDVYKALASNGLVVSVEQIEATSEAAGYIEDNCRPLHESFSKQTTDHKFISEPHFDISWTIAGNPRKRWK